MLLVASDRISTFDVILPTEIPDKGRVLTGLSGFWFARTRDLVPNHLLALRDDMRRLGIERVQLVSFGTTDPSVYGIRYVPFFNGRPDPGVPWFAVSSYFMAGLPARLVLSSGSTGTQQYDCRALLARDPVATPGNCMYLYRLH